MIFDKNKKEAKQIEDEVKKKIDEKKKKKRGWRFKLACVGFVFGILAVLVSCIGFLVLGGYAKSWGCNIVTDDSTIAESLNCGVDEEESGQGTDTNTNNYNYNVIDFEGTETNATDLETVITDVVEQRSNTVVGIGLFGDTFSQDQIIGTGFIVSSDGLVITNNHVVSQGEDEDYYVLTSDGERQLQVTEIYQDRVNDIALLEVDGEDLPAAPLGSSDNLRVGQTVIAIGNPLGDLTGTVTSGIISGLNRDVEVGSGFFNTGNESFENVIQTDAAINPGNSGGPLFNSRGEVIGVNFATIQGADNLSFALPIDRVKQRINELNEFGDLRVPFVGVAHRRRIVFIENEPVVGAQVARIVEGSPADQAGLQVGDVIVQFDGESLEDTTFFNLVQDTDIGQEIELVIIRNDEQQTLQLTIGERSNFQN
jgi:serine protease Do